MNKKRLVIILIAVLIIITLGVTYKIIEKNVTERADFKTMDKDNNSDSFETTKQAKVIDGIIYFPDSNFENAIKTSLNIKDKNHKITVEEAKKVTELNIENYNIDSIAGIEYFLNLESLNCMNNKIVDISNIKKLLNLKTLLVAKNFIKDIEVVSNLDKLEILNIAHNDITDISPIKDLKYLEYPVINANPILDFSILYNKIDSMTVNEAKALNLPISDSYITNAKASKLKAYKNNEKAIEQMQKWVKENIKENMSDLEKEYTIINHIIDKLEYITDEETYSEVDLYKIYVEGKSVCFGYALIFQYLANFSGLESYQVETFLSAEEIDMGLENHVWNIVKIDDKYYQLDITWADSNIIDYKYINISNKKMSELHNNELPIFKLKSYPETITDMPEEVQLKYQIYRFIED